MVLRLKTLKTAIKVVEHTAPELAAVSDKKPDEPAVPKPIAAIDDKPDEPAAKDMMAITNVEVDNFSALLKQRINTNMKDKNLIYILAGIGGITVVVLLIRIVRMLFFKGGN